MEKYQSFSAEQTKELGFKLAKKILKQATGEKDNKYFNRVLPARTGNPFRLRSGAKTGPFKQAVVLALSGNLGSGKTTFIQGFARGLGIKKRLTSPTFLLIKRFPLRHKNFKNVFHIDAYRLKKPAALKKLGFSEMTNSPSNIVLIEWAEKIKPILPSKIIWLKFDYGKKPVERKIKISL